MLLLSDCVIIVYHYCVRDALTALRADPSNDVDGAWPAGNGAAGEIYLERTHRGVRRLHVNSLRPLFSSCATALMIIIIIIIIMVSFCVYRAVVVNIWKKNRTQTMR